MTYRDAFFTVLMLLTGSAALAGIGLAGNEPHGMRALATEAEGFDVLARCMFGGKTETEGQGGSARR